MSRTGLVTLRITKRQAETLNTLIAVVLNHSDLMSPADRRSLAAVRGNLQNRALTRAGTTTTTEG